MREEIALCAFGELDDTNNVPHRDDDAHNVQDPQAQLPSHARECFGVFGADASVHAEVPLDRDEHEEEEYDDLEDQTGQGHVLAQILFVFVVGLGIAEDAGADGLDEEAENVAYDKDLGEPGDPDGR